MSTSAALPTTPPAANAGAGSSTDALTQRFRRQREAFAADRYPDVAARRDRLERVADIVKRNERALVAAIDRDFGHRSAHETRIAELYIVAAEARHAVFDGALGECESRSASKRLNAKATAKVANAI